MLSIQLPHCEEYFHFNKNKCPGAPRVNVNSGLYSYDFVFHNIHIPSQSHHIIQKKHRKCPSPPSYKKDIKDIYEYTYSYDYNKEKMYNKVENNFAIQSDIMNSCFPDKTRVLVGRIYYKNNESSISMKKLLLFVKEEGKWVRKEVELERVKDDSLEYDISFD